MTELSNHTGNVVGNAQEADREMEETVEKAAFGHTQIATCQ
ncbi:hypothetical protein [Pedobacter foliorum]|nr:hypothetical protein [Pedobacter foliorum]